MRKGLGDELLKENRKANKKLCSIRNTKRTGQILEKNFTRRDSWVRVSYKKLMIGEQNPLAEQEGQVDADDRGADAKIEPQENGTTRRLMRKSKPTLNKYQIYYCYTVMNIEC